MLPKDNPHDQASNTDKTHSPEKGPTLTEQQANAQREDRGKAPLHTPDDEKATDDPSQSYSFGNDNGAATINGKPAGEATDEDWDKAKTKPGGMEGQAATDPIPPQLPAEQKPPTVSPASAKQTSANLVQTHGTFSGFSEPATDGKSTGEFTIHIVRQPNDSRSDEGVVFAALQDEYEKARANRQA